MTRNETPPDQNGGTGHWLKSNLSALGSATVFAVYAAGFVRTKAAADSFADQPVRRSPAAPISPAVEADVAPAPTVSTPVLQKSTASQPAVKTPAADSAPAAAKAPPKAAAKAAPAVASTPMPIVAPGTASVAAAAPVPVVAAPVTAAPIPAPVRTVAATPAPTPVPTLASTPASTPTPAPSVPTPVPVATATAASTPVAAAAPKRVGFKDGTFVGYGRSRHGNIEATVDVVGGQIVAATITDCATEYPCSWIVNLPPQVVIRQSSEVDIVSGATASSDAFYAAVVAALNKAK